METLRSASPVVNPDCSRHGLRAPRGGCTVAGRLFKGGQFCLPFDPSNPHGLEVVETPAVAQASARHSIRGFVYEVAPIPVAAECGTLAFDLHKLATNNTYHVLRDVHGLVTCDCPDFLFRHEGTAGMCKHGAKLVELGMIPAPTPNLANLRNAIPTRIDGPAHRRGRFVPSPDEMAEASQLFGDLAADRVAYRRELAAAL